MITKAQQTVIAEELYGTPRTNVYAVLDGASVPDLLPALQTHDALFCCLYRGTLAPDLAAAAPYLVHVPRRGELLPWLLSQGWGQHWGIFVVSAGELRALRTHFRTLLLVKTPEGKQVYFRYYDPRVLRTFLPTCSVDERKKIHGPVMSYVCEAEDPATMLVFAPGGEEARDVPLPVET